MYLQCDVDNAVVRSRMKVASRNLAFCKQQAGHVPQLIDREKLTYAKQNDSAEDVRIFDTMDILQRERGCNFYTRWATSFAERRTRVKGKCFRHASNPLRAETCFKHAVVLRSPR